MLEVYQIAAVAAEEIIGLQPDFKGMYVFSGGISPI
jgi:hypothetical protein